MSRGQWCFFHDINNQSGLCGIRAPEHHAVLERLAAYATTRAPLKTNCRNSLPILRKVQQSLEADMGVDGIGDGPEVRSLEVARHEAARALATELTTLVEDEGFLPSEIMVLSPCSFERSCAHALPEDVRKILTPLDESAVHAPSRRAAGFAQVGHYKGLESEAVILVDLPSPGTDEELRPFHYVGMSRARALLSLICVAPGEVWKTPCK